MPQPARPRTHRISPPSAAWVSLVGAGPGDPGLMTLKGAERLGAADVVLYDRLVHPEVLELTAPEAALIHVGKAAGRPSPAQEAVNERLIALARPGRLVVRLKGGDPFLFGRGGEEAAALARAGVPFEVVPGVTSAVAAPAYAGIPVTDRRVTSSVTFVSGHLPPGHPDSQVDWSAMAAIEGTLVILMGVRNAGSIAAALLTGGRAATTPAAIVESGTYDHQRTSVSTLGDLASVAAAGRVSSPAVIVVGEVVDLRASLAWFDAPQHTGSSAEVMRVS